MMKLHFGKYIICIAMLSLILIPGTAQGMSAPSYDEHSATSVSDITPGDPTFAVKTSAVSHTVNIYAIEAAYVYDQMATTNFNASPYGNHLVVGTGQEFGGQEWTFIEFGPVKESRGGPLPEGSTITGVELKLYKESGSQGGVNVYQPQTDFSESSLTWNNKPNLYSPVRGSATLSSSNGWCTIGVNSTIVLDPENHNRNTSVAIKPAWTDSGKEVSFQSDENPSYKPRLVITYTGAAPEPQTEPTPPPAGDTTPCVVTYSVTPRNPRVGESVTITARATDDQAMYYLTIARGMSELARSDAAPGQRELTVSYTEEAVLPSLSYIIVGDDLGDAPAQGGTVTVPVAGSGTPPEVTINAEWETETIPDRYRLVAGDGQSVTLTATATDPDGIRMLTISINGRAYDWTFGGETSVTRTLEWTNDNPSLTFFSYFASAVDRENTYTSTESVSTDVAQPHDILVYSAAAPGFHNPSRDRLPWERMVQTFGAGECYTVEDWDWKSWYALIWYHAGFKEIADNGECFGMSTIATELYKSRIIANDIESTASCPAYMNKDNTFTKEYVEARQGGQMSEEVLFTRYHERYVSTSDKLARIEEDLERNTPGVLSIREGDGGHAIVPWMSRHMDDDTTRVYVYDCNREGAIIPIIEERDSGHPSYDFDNYDLFPYIEISGGNWNYIWPDGATWNDELAYFRYEEACGDMNQDNPLGESSFAPSITDHDLPSVFQYMFCPIGGDADAYIEDEDGNITGIYNGEIREEIPDSMAIIPMGAPFSEHELYILPVGKKLHINVVGNDDGEYSMGFLGDGTLFGMHEKRIRRGSTDTITVDPTVLGILGYMYGVQPGTEDDNFLVVVDIMFEGLVAATDSDHIEREAVMEDTSCSEESDFSCFFEEDGDTFVAESYGDDIEFDLGMRSSESADAVDSLEDIDYVPGSVEEDITLGGGDRLEATPEDWATTEERAPLHTLNKKAKSGSKDSGFPVIPVVIGVCVVAVAAVVVIFILKKGASARAGK